MNKVAFSLERHIFRKVNIDLDNKSSQNLQIAFNPSGEFEVEKSLFNLKFDFEAKSDDTKNPFINIEFKAVFKFENVKNIEEIPPYFYRNAIAIVFPYVRAFVSTVTLQANIPPVVLPTMNLSPL
ncbi:protein-export chaperone SecB [Chryseobacterium camelliae]|uniref:Protein-export chaperone SecB n=1 Tax=Chryseobacterium camelliae TaxID=1265445 RepID=A0ABY7QIL3_9FLAO|nr:protein-export chaperone SecB [Chryseobacterium camelliae]WBV59480.1 protein-export chaperone SecB [Chryseobacterium camelliae]